MSHNVVSSDRPDALQGTWLQRLSSRSGAARTTFFVVVLENPELNDQNLTYVVGGEMPEKGSEVSMFIDIIGMPLTALSYAGVAKRSFRRAVLY